MALIDFIALAVLVVLGIVAFQRTRGNPAAAEPAIDPEAQRLADEVRELRARIQVLERIITDNHGSADLRQEIERLRDR